MPHPARVKYWLRRRIGYGRLRAPFWFFGMEESCNDAAAEVDARLVGGAVEDLWAAHLRLAPVFDNLFDDHPSLQPTWRPLIATVLAATGNEYTADAARIYQAHRLGRSDDETLLAELMPLPSPGIAGWPYAALEGLPELHSREAYLAAWAPLRVAWLARVIRVARPRAVVAYGAMYEALYREMFPADAAWIPFVVGGAEWAQTATFEVDGVQVVAAITPHPVAPGNMNKHWISLGEWIAANARAE